MVDLKTQRMLLAQAQATSLPTIRTYALRQVWQYALQRCQPCGPAQRQPVQNIAATSHANSFYAGVDTKFN
jgi:hypothetical protein